MRRHWVGPRTVEPSLVDLPQRRGLGVMARLVISYALIMVVISGVVGVLLQRAYNQRWDRHAFEELNARALEVSAALAKSAGAGRAELVEEVRRTPMDGSIATVLIGADGEMIVSSRFVEQPAVDAAVAAQRRRPSAWTPTVRGGYSTLVVPVDTRHTAVLVRDMSDIRRFMATYTRLALIAAPVAVLIGSVVTYIQLRRLRRAVATATAAARRIAAGDLRQQVVPLPGSDDFGDLMATMNLMSRNVSGLITGQRETLSAASHQLRTPLTVIRGRLDVQLRRGLDDHDGVARTMTTVIEEVDHMNAVVGRLLDLATAWEPAALRDDPVELDELLRDVHAAAASLGDRVWRIDPVEPIVVAADRTQLRGALLNLVHNAHAATPAGSTITLGVTRRGANVLIDVVDRGCGMTSGELTAARARFGRGAAASIRGHGLGLAIVTAVAEAHGGRLVLVSDPGAGTTASIELPSQRILALGSSVGGVRT